MERWEGERKGEAMINIMVLDIKKYREVSSEGECRVL